jgi:hypothetical protein
MLRVTDPALENLMFLRDVTIPWMREHPERVDFALFNSECGTYGCLLGWYHMQRFGRRYAGSDMDLDGSEEKHFGINGISYYWLFGSSNDRSIEDRAARVDALIAEKLAALEVA